MTIIEALILGLIQGLTEFLPVSSSGHLELGNAILNIQAKENLTFAITVHGATVLSTIVVFYKDLQQLFAGFFRFKWNEETMYVSKLLFSMIPVLIIGAFFKDEIESFFTGNLLLVGSALLVTALLLAFTYFAKERTKNISFLHAFIIGIAQALAVIPGISRSGATISTGLILGNKKKYIAKFSFLMVLIPIIGANIIELLDYDPDVGHTIGAMPLIAGFIMAFVSGLLACRWMIRLVKKGKLIYFAIYCLAVGLIAIFVA